MEDILTKYPVPGFPNNFVTVTGIVYGPRGPLKPRRDGRGYYCVDLRKDGKSYNKKVHAVVMLTFCGPTPAGCHIDHKNHNTADNKLRNLEFRKDVENCADSDRSNNGKRRKVTPDLVEAILHCHNNIHFGTAKLARVFNLGETTVRRIIHGNKR